MSSKLLRVVFAVAVSVALSASLALAQDKAPKGDKGDKGKAKGKAMTALTGKLTVAKAEDGKKTVTLDVTGADGKVVTYTVVTNPKNEKDVDALNGKMVDAKGVLGADGKTLSLIAAKEAGKADKKADKKGGKPEKKQKEEGAEGGDEM